MVKQIRERLEDAIAAGDFARAHQLIPQYSKGVVAALKAIESNTERERTAATLLASFEHLLTLARVSRSHISAHLTCVTRDLFWTQTLQHRSPSHSWHVDA
jgi:hypothetical protein